MTKKRKSIPSKVRNAVLIEAGYRCGVPTCRNILAIDLHHMVEVSEGGGNTTGNLLALCPTCHALFHRGTYSREAIYSWKSILVALNQAFDLEAIDNLLFLNKLEPGQLLVTGDGVLKFTRLIAADLVSFRLLFRNGPLVNYEINTTTKGQLLIEAWKEGDRSRITEVLQAESNNERK